MGTTKIAVLVVAIVVALVVYASVFTVDEREWGLKFQLGEIKRVYDEPGLYFKMPLVNNVRKFDGRILTLDARPQQYLTKEKKFVNVDFFVKWRINDVRTFYQTMSGGDERVAQERIYTIINEGLRGEFSNRLIQEVISGERREIMSSITGRGNDLVSRFGVEIVDVRIKRIDFSQQISDSVFRRMEAERARVAKDLRSRGAEAAERIRADADRQRTVIIAEAYRDAQKQRGEGDAKAADIYATAYKKNPEFFAFYRSLEAYRTSFARPGDIMVLQPDSKFFEYFKTTKPQSK